MSLSSLSFLQLGDIHWPDLKNLPREIDHKDIGMSPNAVRYISASPATIVFRELQSITTQQNAILLTGDITTKSNHTQYKNFLTWFKSLIGEDQIKKVFIVCGNHDIKWKLSSEEELYSKFKPLNKILTDLSFRGLPEEKAIIEQIIVNGSSVMIIALNSCIGCGSKRYLNPFEIENLDKELKSIISSNKKDFYERLDTPSFNEAQLHDVLGAINKSDKAIPIILTHHNLLPQVRPRMLPYGELINGGLARSKFVYSKKPIIYLHGHIHSDAIEIISQEEIDGKLLISIAAPEIKDGFNVIKIEFNSSGYPLGCIIEKWRRLDSQEMGKEKQYIPFWGNFMLASKKISPKAHELYSFFETNQIKLIRIDELIYNFNYKRDEIKSLLLELQWFRAIQIDDIDSDLDYWTVRRITL